MSFEGCESAFYKSFGTSSDTSFPAAVLTGWLGRGGQFDSGAAVPTAGVVRGLVPLGESPTPCLVPLFHLHLEIMALHLPLTGFQICPLTWLDLHSLEEPHARSQWKTGPEPTSRTLTPTSLAHTPAWRPESARLTRQRTPTPATPVPWRALWDTPPHLPTLHQSPSDGSRASEKSVLSTRQNPRAECCHSRAKEQLLTGARWGQVFKSMVAGGTEHF